MFLIAIILASFGLCGIVGLRYFLSIKATNWAIHYPLSVAHSFYIGYFQWFFIDKGRQTFAIWRLFKTPVIVKFEDFASRSYKPLGKGAYILTLFTKNQSYANIDIKIGEGAINKIDAQLVASGCAEFK
ncbi:hypothetical protein [Gluconobacter cerinus]|uniref:hypothetical protein n=1 Tax=Gluconobacter cerinus TaxID=38307 RepID=UPI001B8C652D|nr:hypothetical protein [Gluconobacter cerinus]MBS0984263.1 hypothetical protein [Gluconobacter cerinus]